VRCFLVWSMERGVEVNKITQKIQSGSGRRSVIPYIHFFCIALGRACNTKLEEACECECAASVRMSHPSRRVTVPFYRAKSTIYNVWLTGGLHCKS
jgi:hypothetical protein